MSFKFLIALMAITTTALAMPHLVKRPTGDYNPCAGMGDGAFDNAPNITLAIYNVTNGTVSPGDTPEPLSLISYTTELNNGEVAQTTGTLTTKASYPDPVFPNISLVNGTLIPSGSGIPGMLASSFGVSWESLVIFSWSEYTEAIEWGDESFCAVPNAQPGILYPILSAIQDMAGFSMCLAPNDVGDHYDLVYRPESGTHHYDYYYDTCYPVVVAVQGV